MKNSNLLIIALLAITVATSSSAYYLFTRSQISADTIDPGFPSIPGMSGFDPTTTPVQVPPVPTIPTSTSTLNATSTVVAQSTATSNTNTSTQNTSSSQPTNTDSGVTSSSSSSSSDSSSSATRRTIAGNSGSFSATPTASPTASAEIAAIGIITETPMFTAVPEQTIAAATKQGSNSTVWMLIIVSLGAIAGLGYVLFRKKPGQIDQTKTADQTPTGSIPPEGSATPQATEPTNIYSTTPAATPPAATPTELPIPQNPNNQPQA